MTILKTIKSVTIYIYIYIYILTVSLHIYADTLPGLKMSLTKNRLTRNGTHRIENLSDRDYLVLEWSTVVFTVYFL